jgi:predicted CoA-substrate-specific enzyme activase
MKGYKENMITAGLDVGSRTIKLVTFNGELLHSALVPTGVRPLERCAELLNGVSYEKLVITGYGRYLVAETLKATIVSEISAYAAGAAYLYPDCRTVIDVGGQDSKVIQLNERNGGVQKFEMNDRCAAGTGKFLEVMADTLEVPVSELGGLALSAGKVVHINSLCTVFAESEVVSLIARGEDVNAIALALHRAVATRIASMARRVGIKGRVVFAGGVAQNPCLTKLLAEELGVPLTIPENPQLVGALGAALMAKSG